MINMENKNTETIKMMYLEDRPYEKCEQYGAEHLTDVELFSCFTSYRNERGEFAPTCPEDSASSIWL